MTKTLEHIFNYYKTFDRTSEILIAASGGVDSMVLLNICQILNLNFSIAHFNYGLRGHESDHDESFLSQWAKDNNRRIFIKKDVSLLNLKSDGKSIQLKARDLRQKWFRELLIEHDFKCLFTAHHLNDRVETSIFNYIRGTGLKGLISIEEENFEFVRPLINTSKDEIIEYALSKDIKWREDSSNEKLDYSRNIIRHKILPVFEEVKPNWIKGMQKTYLNLENTEEAMLFFGNKLMIDLIIGMEQNTFFYHCPNPYFLFWALKRESEFTENQCEQFWDALEMEKESFWLEKNEAYLGFSYGTIKFYPGINRAIPDIKIDLEKDVCHIENTSRDMEIFVQTLTRNHFKDEDLLYVEDNYALLDADKLPKGDFFISSWRKGDKYRPLGLNGTKKLSDMFSDLKIPKPLRTQIPILRDSSGKIIWVNSGRVAEEFAVTLSTNRIIEIEVKFDGEL